jgi:hypothetical protein
MEISELKSSIDIVFEKEIRDLHSGYRTLAVNESKNEYVITYPHAETLVQLYLTIRSNEKLKSFFIKALEDGIINSDGPILLPMGTYLGISRLCFYTLVNVGYVNEAIVSLKKRKSSLGCEGLFNLITEMLPKNYFDSKQLGDILLKTRQMEKTRSEFNLCGEGLRLNTNIINCRYEILTRQIGKINIEINEDKKVVSEKLGRLGFNESYNELLNGIDSFINTDTENFINAGMISNLRTFMADLLKDVASRIAEEKQETIPTIDGRKEMGNIREYLKRKLDLSSNDDEFIDSFVKILHAEGGHAFMSDKEYFRLARNIAIEIALFVLSKYEKNYS